MSTCKCHSQEQRNRKPLRRNSGRSGTEEKEINVENNSVISVLANAHVYLTSFLSVGTGDSIGQSDTNVSGGSVYSQTRECALW